MALYKPFKPEGYTDQYSNGCGPASWKIDFIPDNLLGLDISEECGIHDFGYEVGETIEDKMMHDRILKNNLVRKVLAQTSLIGGVLKRPRLYLALLYFFMAHHYGGPAFWEGKN